MPKPEPPRCGSMRTANGDHHFCEKPPQHPGPHACPCRFEWAPERTYTPSEASVAWRATRPLILDQKPKLGRPFDGVIALNIDEALEDTDNEILWLEQELANQRAYRAELAKPKEG